MRTINTLQDDIYHLLDSDEHHECSPNLTTEFEVRTGGEVVNATSKRNKPREKGKLWASDLGKPCLQQHYYNFNSEAKEKFTGNTKFKFLYGNLLEEAVLYLAEEAGHDVEHRQERVETKVGDWAISGRIDAVIDNILIDVKTTSSFGYKKYVGQGIHQGNDSFGYLHQLGFYQSFGDFEHDSDEQGFVWIDKQNGHIKYMECEVPTKANIVERATNIAKAIEGKEEDAPRYFDPKPYGKSGNMSLPMQCSYCPHKQRCWRDANNGKGLRGFLYGSGPVWFTDVQREPNVVEMSDE